MTDVSPSNAYQSSSVSFDQLTQIFNSMTSGRQPLPSTFAQDFLSQLEAAGVKPNTELQTDTSEMQTNELNNTVQNAVLPQYLLMPSNVIV